MQTIRRLCEVLKAFFTKKPTLVPAIVDDSKILDENTDDLKFHVPPSPTDLEAGSPVCKEVCTSISSALQTLSVPAQMPTALDFLAQQRLVCTAKDTDTQHLDVGKPEERRDASLLGEDLD